MILGVSGPIDTRPLTKYLDSGVEDMPPGMGGIPVVALVRAAMDGGWPVIVFSLDPSITEERIATGPNLKICMGPYRPRHRARDLFRAERQYLAAAISREKPDMVHAHWTYEFALGALGSGRPTVVTAHDRPLSILRWDHSPYRVIRTWMAEMVTRRARCLTAVSDRVAKHFRQYFRWRGPLPVIPNGIEREWFETPAMPGSRTGFTFVSVLDGWTPLKNGRSLLEGYAMVRPSLPGAFLLMCGDNHGDGEEAARWARQRGLAGGVEFAGHLDRQELRMRLQQAGALVHPSREESYSMVVAEAMATGVPVIACRGSGSIAETLDGGQCALLADDCSAQSLAASMLAMARDSCLRTDLARRARAAVCREFSLARVWNAYADLYACVAA